MHGLLLEYTGTLLIAATILFTHGNPILLGLAYTSALFIADGKSEGMFSPLTVLVKYCIGRLTFFDSAQLIAIQVAAALSIVLLHIGKNGLLFTHIVPST